MAVKLEYGHKKVKSNKELKMVFSTYYPNGFYNAYFNYEESKNLLSELLEFLDCNGALKMYRSEPHAYSEEISTYRLKIERTLSITNSVDGRMVLHLVCYTPDKNDDNWIELTLKRTACLASIIGGYVNHYKFK